jgi:hypothetical protein
VDEAAWLLLMHQIPPKPPYLRVKIWRKLQTLGAIALKNSVYVLPNSDEGREDFEWLLREIVKQGGDATLCEARLIDGLTDAQVQASFHAARDSDYAELATAARILGRSVSSKRLSGDRHRQREGELVRLRRRLSEIARIDFFDAPGRQTVEGILSELESRLNPSGTRTASANGAAPKELRGRVWVTRKGLHVDRMASAWLIRRFDPGARFKFVPPKGYRPGANEVRFDMFEAEFTHEGDLCTFEVLLGRLGLEDRGLTAIAEIVHDIDVKDAKFGRPEVPGIDRLIAGIAMAHKDDDERLAHGAAVFDALHECFRRRQR